MTHEEERALIVELKKRHGGSGRYNAAQLLWRANDSERHQRAVQQEQEAMALHAQGLAAVDFDLAQVRAGQSLDLPPAEEPVAAPPEWDEVLRHIRRAVPLNRACALTGLRYDRVRRWLQHNEAAKQQLAEVRAGATAELVGVVWEEATVEKNWKAALSLLAKTDDAFNRSPARNKNNQPPAQVSIHANTAQVLSTADVGQLKALVGDT